MLLVCDVGFTDQFTGECDMDQSLRKLILAAVALLLGASMVVTISYAWLTVSKSPVAEGIQITVSGGTAIIIAPDIVTTLNGEDHHHPGIFSSTLNFVGNKGYEYLQGGMTLSPVSTADGLHWFIPTYYDITDAEIRDGTACVGQTKPIESFTDDTELKYANLTATESAELGAGGYIYVDFWMVSPATDYYLRVSQGDDTGGSYLLELLEPEAKTEGETVIYKLTATDGSAAASARVGFLVNEDIASSESFLAYQESGYCKNDAYKMLKGVYNQKGGLMPNEASTHFTIFEPNADLHPSGSEGYLITEPVANNRGTVELANVSDRLTVQLTNTWREQTADGISIDQVFRTAIFGQTFDSIADVKYKFYSSYLQGQLMPYINKAAFVKNTEALYGYAQNGVVSSDVFTAVDKAGVTDDVTIVLLEKNVPQRIRMFVWIEGQDADCTNGINARDLALSIELAGSQVSPNE